MGIIRRLAGLGTSSENDDTDGRNDEEKKGIQEKEEEYVEIATEEDQFDYVYIAELKRGNLIGIKDRVKNGNLVIADISGLRGTWEMEKIVKDLGQFTEDIGGDIAQKGRDELIIAPQGYSINRERLVE